MRLFIKPEAAISFSRPVKQHIYGTIEKVRAERTA